MKRNYKNDDKKTPQKPTQNVGVGQLNIHQYTFNELLDVFDLKPDLTMEDLKRTRRHVLSLHPDKNRSVSVDHYMFFKGAYELIESYYQTLKRQTIELPTDDIEYDPNFVPKNATVETEIGKIGKKQFNDKFNELYTTNVKEDVDDERLKWFRDDTSNNTYGELKNAKDIHNTFDQIRETRGGMVVYGGEFRPLGGRSGGNSFYDDHETDENGYITCNPFDKLKYDDISRVHRDQVIIPVDKTEFARANKERTIAEYKREPDVKMMNDEQSRAMLIEQEKMRNRMILEKQHNMQKKIASNEQMNAKILSQFMLLQR